MGLPICIAHEQGPSIVRTPGRTEMVMPHILDHKNASSPFGFCAFGLAARGKAPKEYSRSAGCLPFACWIPDGDLVRALRSSGKAKPFAGWPCYHSELDTFTLAGQEVGIVGRVVGASFAVLVAEELFASGCRLLVSLTSAGQVVASGSPPYFVIVDRALRDEGDKPPLRTSCRIRRGGPMACRKCREGHLQRETAMWSSAPPGRLDAPFRRNGRSDRGGPKQRDSWSRYGGMRRSTTFARSVGVPLLCLAHVTNTMGQDGMDFREKLRPPPIFRSAISRHSAAVNIFPFSRSRIDELVGALFPIARAPLAGSSGEVTIG